MVAVVFHCFISFLRETEQNAPRAIQRAAYPPYRSVRMIVDAMPTASAAFAVLSAVAALAGVAALSKANESPADDCVEVVDVAEP